MNQLFVISAAIVLLTAVGSGALDRSGPLDLPLQQEADRDACAKACDDCQRACDVTAAHCATMAAEGKKTYLESMRTCLDVADICAVTARVVARGGPFAGLIVETCAEICLRCAADCEKAPDDAKMKTCAEECRRCEKACRAYLKSAPPHGGHEGHRGK